LRLFNGHCISQSSWQSEGFATPKTWWQQQQLLLHCWVGCGLSSVMYWNMCSVALDWSICQTWCVASLCHILHYQNPEFFLGFCFWDNTLINCKSGAPPPLLNLHFSERYLYWTYLSLWTIIEHHWFGRQGIRQILCYILVKTVP
jgi:hypothetical protein